MYNNGNLVEFSKIKTPLLDALLEKLKQRFIISDIKIYNFEVIKNNYS